MKVKTSELIGPALDWAVAKAEGYDEGWLARQMGNPNPHTRAIPAFSTDWSQGGPIIEREFISISPGEWDVDATPMVQNICAWSLKAEIHGTEKFYYGPTPLVAAMRCFISSKIGDEVDVPEELSN